jgi:hypothetical protein
MSRKLERSLQGPGEVVSAPLSFAQRYVAAGFTLPDQVIVARMMRATEAGLDWDATVEEINDAETNRKMTNFIILDLAEYAQLKNGTYGAPMPRQVAEHIEQVKEKFPDAQVSLAVHVIDDPFVQIELDGERLYTMAWRRHGLEICNIYPK